MSSQTDLDSSLTLLLTSCLILSKSSLSLCLSFLPVRWH